MTSCPALLVCSLSGLAGSFSRMYFLVISLVTACALQTRSLLCMCIRVWRCLDSGDVAEITGKTWYSPIALALKTAIASFLSLSLSKCFSCPSRSVYLDFFFFCNCRLRHLSKALLFREPGPISENVIMLRLSGFGPCQENIRTFYQGILRGTKAARVWLFKPRVVTCELAEGWAEHRLLQK